MCFFVLILLIINRVSVASAKKQAAEEAKSSRIKSIANVPARKTTGSNTVSKAKVKRKSQKMSSLAKKKKKLYCICQTPYDDSKYELYIDLVDICINNLKLILIIFELNLQILCWLWPVQQLVPRWMCEYYGRRIKRSIRIHMYWMQACTRYSRVVLFVSSTIWWNSVLHLLW